MANIIERSNEQHAIPAQIQYPFTHDSSNPIAINSFIIIRRSISIITVINKIEALWVTTVRKHPYMTIYTLLYLPLFLFIFMIGDEGAFHRCLDDTCLWDDDRSTEWLAATTMLEVPVVAAAAAVLLVFVAGALPLPMGRLRLRSLGIGAITLHAGFLHVVTTGWTVTCRCGLVAFDSCWIVVGRHGGNYIKNVRSLSLAYFLSRSRYF